MINLIRGLTIILNAQNDAKARGEGQHINTSTDHHIIMTHANTELIPEDSLQGQALREFGFRVDEEGNWCTFT
jgi:hypothetical protein